MEIKIKRNKVGKERAYYYCSTMCRVFPMKMDEAKILVAKHEADFTDKFFFEL